jgi:AAA domain
MDSFFDTISPDGHTVEVWSLPNKQGRGAIHRENITSSAELDRFIAQYDHPGRALYLTVAKLREGMTRSQEAVEAVYFIWAEVDFKDHPGLTPNEIRRRLDTMPMKATMIVSSGHGYHVYWQLNEAEDATPGENQIRVREALRLACSYISGDPSVAEPARLMRLPGSHNTRMEGEKLLVEVASWAPTTYELSDLVDFWLEAQPILPPPATRSRSNGDGAEPAELGTWETVDIEDRLANIGYKAPGQNAIHPTWKQCLGAMLNRGVTVEAALERIMAATEARCQDDPARDKWWRGLCDLAEWWLNHDPLFVLLLPEELQTAWTRKVAEGRRPQLTHNHLHGLQIRGYPQDKTASNDADAAPAPEGEPAKEAEPQKAPDAWPTPYSGRSAAQLPRRKFIKGEHYLLGAVTVTAAPGGAGKSMLSLLDSVSFAIGRDLLTGEPLEKRRKAWVWGAEDDLDEMERRVEGICAHYGIARGELDGWLFLDSGYDLPLDLAEGPMGKTLVRTGQIDLIAERVKEREIEVVSLDPLVALHTMAEGDNPGHAKLIRTLNNRLAKPCNCSVDIDHHTRKPSAGQEGGMTADDMRGASATVFAARSGRMLHPMSLAEAEKYSIEADDRVDYYRVDRAKANMARRGTICWVHQVMVPIANGPGGSYGDVIAVPTLWVPPNAMQGVSDTIANGIRSEVAKGEYRRDMRAGASWAGRLIALRLGLDPDTKSGKARARTVLETLIKKSVLAVELRTDRHRHTKEYVVPGAGHG